MSLVARHLEENGIPTVIIGSAVDIVEYCGAPRFLFIDYPLGNPCGVPYHREQQRDIVLEGLGLLHSAEQPAQTVRASLEWPYGQDWRTNFMLVSDANRESLRQAGEKRKAQRQALRDQGQVRTD